MDAEQAAFERGVRAGLEAGAKAFECAGSPCPGDTSKCGYADCDPWVADRIRATDPATIKDTGNVHNQGTYNEIP